MSPIYSFTPEQAGLIPLVFSIACAEGRCGDCEAWFRCDCQHHRRRWQVLDSIMDTELPRYSEAFKRLADPEA